VGVKAVVVEATTGTPTIQGWRAAPRWLGSFDRVRAGVYRVALDCGLT
jgi:hypothetical protein